MTDRTGFHNSHHTQSPKVMFIDSKDANVRHVTDTHFTYVFNESIHVKQNEGVLVSLLQASVPYSFYNIRSGVNDTLVVRVQVGAGTFGADQTVTIPGAPGHHEVLSPTAGRRSRAHPPGEACILPFEKW